jgi:serine/threonine protein kinase
VVRPRTWSGPPAYAAPEQLAGEKAAAPADVFAWASTICYAATGRVAFGAESIPAVMHRILAAPPDLEGVLPACAQLSSAACRRTRLSALLLKTLSAI